MSLVFTPVVLSEGRISLKVMTEVSDLSTDNALTLAVPGSTQTLTIPSISTRRAETTVEIPSGGSLALAGMIQQKTKQQINGVPGLMQLPVLGSLFRSRDYINNQTELMVLVTPYIVHAVAQKQLSRPDDGFSDPNDQSTALLGRLNRIYGAAGKAEPAQRIPRQIRIHSRLSGMGRRSMSGFLTTMAKRRGATALRILAVVGLATSLAGCYTQRVAQQEAYPDDYHERHPITLKEGERTVEIFVGRNRGGLTPSQRADVLSFAQVWRHEATSGILVDVPQGRLIGRAAAEFAARSAIDSRGFRRAA